LCALVSIGALESATHDEKLFYEVNVLQAIHIRTGAIAAAARDMVRKRQDDQNAYLRAARNGVFAAVMPNLHATDGSTRTRLLMRSVRIKARCIRPPSGGGKKGFLPFS
jgi:hypothetical protein